MHMLYLRAVRAATSGTLAGDIGSAVMAAAWEGRNNTPTMGMETFMIDGLVAGRLYGEAERRTDKAGKAYTLANSRAMQRKLCHGMTRGAGRAHKCTPTGRCT